MHRFYIHILPIIIFLAFVCARDVSAQDKAFTSDTPYEEAVPAFLDAIVEQTASVKDETELASIASWEESVRSRLQEFLNDFIAVSIDLENISSQEELNSRYTEVVTKWSDEIFAYPGLDELAPVLNPVINELFSGLPQLRAVQKGDVPFSNHFELFQQLESENPWSVGAFFRVEPVADSVRIARYNATTRETTEKGIHNINILFSVESKFENGEIVFFELIQDNQVLGRFIKEKDPTLVHEVLKQAILNNLDEPLIMALQALVDLIDEELLLAVNNGILDQKIYNIMYGNNYQASNYESLTTYLNTPNINNSFYALEEGLAPAYSLTNPLDYTFNEDEGIKDQGYALLDKQAMERTYSDGSEDVLSNYEVSPKKAMRVFLMVFVLPLAFVGLLDVFRSGLPF